ncbi:MAG: GIY-YIG nuclease family protein [Campylobacterota bacterium]
MDRLTLEEILQSDPLEVLKDIKPKAKVSSDEQRLIDGFESINKFYEVNGFEPKKNTNISQRQLASKLEGYRRDNEKIKLLKPHDKFNLLQEKKQIKASSLDDILDNDILGVLDESENDIFTLKHIPKEKETTMPEYVAKRKPCKDFAKYENILKTCQEDLKIGKRKIVKFQNEQQIREGYFFILKGVLLYVAKVGKTIKQSGKTNARLKLIFENGTESDMLLRSLSAELYKHGKRVTEYDESKMDGLYNKIDKDDIPTGYIYILKSLSQDERISTIKDLYKIGYSTTSVEKRIKNAKNEATYLMADVEIVAVYETYNLNTQKFENLVHRFFSKVRLDLKINDSKKDLISANEWFVVPFNVINEAIELLESGEILDYIYDKKNERIIKNDTNRYN